MAEAVPRNARIRRAGTKNLVAAALAAGTRRLISQSIAWRAQGITADGVQALEHPTLESPPLEGIVLRYGRLYGPGTGREAGGGEMPLHVDAAASAALLALEKGRAGTITTSSSPMPRSQSTRLAASSAGIPASASIDADERPGAQYRRPRRE